MREYYGCANCGKNTWRNTEGPSSKRDELCKECWDEVQVPDGIHHCSCGSFAQAGSRLCWRCNRIYNLELTISTLRNEVQEERMEKSVCQNKNIGLMSKVKAQDETISKYAKKAKYPYSLQIEEYNGACNEAYLKSVLEAASNFPGIIKVTYERR